VKSSLSSLVQGSPEWIEWRKGGIGASEIAAVAGLCPYGTPYKVWLVKTGRAKEFAGNSFTRHGQETEARARARYELINMEDMPPACATHPKFEICRSSLDGLSADNRVILELKCPPGRNVLEVALGGNVIDYYVPQTQYQLAVAGSDVLHYFVYHEESKQDALVEVRPDFQYQAMLFSAALEFWQKYVLTDTPPPLTERDDKLVDDLESRNICAKLLDLKKDGRSHAKKMADVLKRELVKLAGHPRVRCGNILISVSGSTYRMTVGKGA